MMKNKFVSVPLHRPNQPIRWVIATEGEKQLRLEIRAERCGHELTEVRDRISSNGNVQRREQCLKCGCSASNALKQYSDATVGKWDIQLEKNWRKQKEKRISEIEEKWVARTDIQNAKTSIEYRSYLNSDEWQSKRTLVLKRDNYLCQGCLLKKATDVHHLTYRNVCNEFLFQLKSLCKECHDRWHDEDDS